ncbi:hypothetical protein DTO166G4_8882 [Paecilomyces variotii]|nr:hypothetical protein DTO166G4_8882 [Paecilomyces variotii]KAJ9227943.1 hypothetical protein DTO166G5_9014 [Paecilomyces variotii]KAJ9254312.1 hypothetical protein DTO195F2_6677 [Paecilomyces variotii]KAJ9306614.1 hypothetical protein DTO217A2_3966 [Paecilomyces variotii]KAJ9367486.1 hypothetical protein DTO282E5_7859 [Paecilomyces variotii]
MFKSYTHKSHLDTVWLKLQKGQRFTRLGSTGQGPASQVAAPSQMRHLPDARGASLGPECQSRRWSVYATTALPHC